MKITVMFSSEGITEQVENSVKDGIKALFEEGDPITKNAPLFEQNASLRWALDRAGDILRRYLAFDEHLVLEMDLDTQSLRPLPSREAKETEKLRTTERRKSHGRRRVEAGEFCDNCGNLKPATEWENDELQFARLLCELVANVDDLEHEKVAGSMNIDTKQLMKLYDRAYSKWDKVKQETARREVSNKDA